MPGASSSVTSKLWSYYVEYLWNYKADSTVAKAASTFRILAFLLILPIVILTLLDVSSYVIARSLGIVDDVKASTSDKKTVHAIHAPPTIRVDSAYIDASTGPSTLSDTNGTSPAHSAAESQASLTSHAPSEYFTSETENLKLSGFDLFSPAPSQPPSPTFTRQKLQPEFHMTPVHGQQQQDDGINIRRRKNGDSDLN